MTSVLAGTASPIPITVDSSSLTGVTIPSGFVGFSWEVPYVAQTLSLNNNAPLKAILSVMGKNCSVRFGGHGADTTIPSLARLTDAALFVQAISNFPLIYGHAYQQISPNVTVANTASTDASQAATLAATLGASNLINQIGNEPNIYTGVSFSSYQTNWQTIHDAIAAAVPGALFAGPDMDISSNVSGAWASLFAATLGSQSSVVTIHTYGAAATGNPATDIQGAWDNQVLSNAIKTLSANTVILVSGLPLRLSESGNIFGSNATEGPMLGSCLFNLKAMILAAKAAWKSVHFHSAGDTGGYNPVILSGDGINYQAQSTLYAMVLFNYLVGGQILKTTGLHDSALLGVLGQDGKTRVLITNFNLYSALPANVSNEASWTSASAAYLTAPSFDSPNVQIGGSAIGSSGSFSPSFASLARNSDGTVSINVPASSAALVTFSP